MSLHVHNGHSFLSYFTKCCCIPLLALGSTVKGHSGLVMDKLEGHCHVGQFLHATSGPQILNSSCTGAPWSCCGTAAPLGQRKNKGRAGMTWSHSTPLYPKLRSLLTDPKKGPVHMRHAPRRSPIITSRFAHALCLSPQPWIT